MKRLTSFILRWAAGYILILINFPLSALIFYIIFAITNYNEKQFQSIQDAVIIILGMTNFYFHVIAAQKMKWIKSLNFITKYLLLTLITVVITPIIYYFENLIIVRYLRYNELVLVPKLLYFGTISFCSQFLIWNLHFQNDFPLQILLWYFLSWVFLFLVNVSLPIHFLGCVLYTFVMKQSIFRFATIEIWTVKFRVLGYFILLMINFTICTELAHYFYRQDPAGYIINTLFFMGHLHIGLIYVSLSFSLEIQKWVLKDKLMIYPYICFCYFWGIQLAFLNFFIYRKIFVPYFLHKVIGKNVLPIDNLYNTVPSGYIARLFFCLIFSESKDDKKLRLAEKQKRIINKILVKKQIKEVIVEIQIDDNSQQILNQQIQPEIQQQIKVSKDTLQQSIQQNDNSNIEMDLLQERPEIQISISQTQEECIEEKFQD